MMGPQQNSRRDTERQIHLVDDNHGFRESMVSWLSSIGYGTSDFGHPQQYLDFVRKGERLNAKRCVLLDVRMPALSGLEVHDALSTLGVVWPVIYMTGYSDVPLTIEAMQRGAVTLLEKPFPQEALECALTLAFEKRALLRAWDERARAALPSPAQRAFEQRLAQLTMREREVLQFLIDGNRNKTIAHLMDISVRTVELHRAHIMAKMNTRSLAQLVKMIVWQEVEV